MMKQSAWRQMTEPCFWAGFLVIICTLSMALDVQKAIKLPSTYSGVLHRHKRAWKWDKLYVYEETTPPPSGEKIGKVNSPKYDQLKEVS